MRKILLRTGLAVSGVFAIFGLVTAIHAATQLASVNGTVITLEDFNKRYKESLKFFQLGAPSKETVLNDLVKRELAIQEARRSGLDKDPEVVERMNTVLYHALIEKKLSKDFEQIQISDADAQSYYEKNPEVRTSHIFVALAPNAPIDDVNKAKARINDAVKQLKEGKSFAEVAQRHSEGPSAPMGGDLDYQTRDKLDPAYYEAALKLKTAGKVSEVIRTQFGFHIIKLTGLRPWDQADKAQVKRQLFDQRRQQAFDRYMDQLKKQSKVTVNSALLKD